MGNEKCLLYYRNLILDCGISSCHTVTLGFWGGEGVRESRTEIIPVLNSDL